MERMLWHSLREPLAFPSPAQCGCCERFPSLLPALVQFPVAMGAQFKPPSQSNKDKMIILVEESLGRDLIKHLLDRKCEFMEAGLLSQKVAKNSSSVALPKKSRRGFKLGIGESITAGSEDEAKSQEKLIQFDKTGEGSSQQDAKI